MSNLVYYLYKYARSLTRSANFRSVEVEENNSEELVAPLQFLVELGTYTSLQKCPSEQDIVYKRFHGATIAGVPWLLS